MPEEIFGLEFEKPILELEAKIEELKRLSETEDIDFTGEIMTLEKRCVKLKKDVYSSLTSWQKVLLARHPKRPYSLDYIGRIFTDFVEIHGDRNFGDDEALIGGIAKLNGRKVMVLAHQKGRDIQESMRRNFGMPHPEGYRKAMRLMKMAEKFSIPVICFIDTPGAYPGVGAEERGQATAIAENLRAMALLRVPIISIVIGEGGSGGALAIGVTDRILMLENAYYSVISPEGCAAILFRDSGKAPDAAKALKITSRDLKQLSVIDEIVKEPDGGAHRDYGAAADFIKDAFERVFVKICDIPTDELLKKRFIKYRNLGVYLSGGSKPKNLNKKRQKSKK